MEIDEQKTKERLALFINEYMQNNGLSMKGLSNKVNLSENTIKNFSRGEVLPTVDALYNLSIYLHVDMIHILDLPSTKKKVPLSKEQLIEKVDGIQNQLEHLKEYIQNEM